MIERNLYIDKIRPFFNKDIIKVLVGMRRSGKSIMLKLIKNELIKSGVSENSFICINFESARYGKYKAYNELYTYLEKKIKGIPGKAYIMLDEIQEVTDWQLCINSLMVDFDVDIYITGSNAKLLSGELATYLAGRYIELKVYPFSYREILDLYRSKNTDVDENKVFIDYLTYGGMPFMYQAGLEGDDMVTYLTDIYNSVLMKDIVQRNNIRDTELLERIITFILSNIGATVSAKAISDYFKSEMRRVAPETIYNYLSACENAYLLHRVKRQDLKGKAILKTQEKFYVADHGIREAVFGYNRRDIEKVLENIVFMELKRRGYAVTVGNYEGKEIDFVADRRGQRIYIQVTYVMAIEETRIREFAPFLKLNDNYPKYVLSLLDEADFSENGIIHMNIRDFLKADYARHKEISI